MAVMPDIFGDLAGEYRQREHDAAGTMRHLMRHGAPAPASPAPAGSSVQQPAPQPTATTSQEEPMSLQVITELEQDARALVAKFKAIDREALQVTERAQANPATKEILAIAGALAHVDPGELATLLGVARMTLAALGGQLPPAADPAQPEGAA